MKKLKWPLIITGALIIICALFLYLVFRPKITIDKNNKQITPSISSPQLNNNPTATEKYIDFDNGFVFLYPKGYQIYQDIEEFNKLFLPNSGAKSYQAILLETTKDLNYLEKIIPDYCSTTDDIKNCVSGQKTPSSQLIDDLKSHQVIYGSRTSNLISSVSMPSFIDGTQSFILIAPYEYDNNAIVSYNTVIKYITLVDKSTLVILTFRGHIGQQVQNNSPNEIEKMIKRDFPDSLLISKSFISYGPLYAKNWQNFVTYNSHGNKSGYSIKYPLDAKLEETGKYDFKNLNIKMPTLSDITSRIFITSIEQKAELPNDLKDIELKSGTKARLMKDEHMLNNDKITVDYYYLTNTNGDSYSIQHEYTNKEINEFAIKQAQEIINTFSWLN